MNLFLQFCRKIWNEQTWGALSITALLVVCAIVSVTKLSVPSINFVLPQPLLGGALFLIVLSLVTLKFLDYRATAQAQPLASEGIFRGMPGSIFGSQPQDPSEKQIRLSISGSEEGMSFWQNDEAGELRAWLDVINFTASPIRIDRIVGEIQVNNSVVGELHHLRIETIKGNSAFMIFLKCDLSAEQIKRITFQREHSSDPVSGVGLMLTVYAQISGESLEIRRSVKTGNHRFVNFVQRSNK